MASIEEKMAAIEVAASVKSGCDPEKGKHGNLDREQLSEMTVKDLTVLATEMGLEIRRNMKKAELVNMIAAEPVLIPEETVLEVEAQTNIVENVEPAEPAKVEGLHGRVLVTYTGMVNLRDENLKAVGYAMQGQTFPVIGKRTEGNNVWYRIVDQSGNVMYVSATVVRLIV